jgi:hypothetical protein
MEADPLPSITDALKRALSAASDRRRLDLPAKDRARRASRARKIAAAYESAAKTIAAVARQRQRDDDLTQLTGALRHLGSSYTAIANAAKASDTTRDQRARAAIARRDRALSRALAPLKTRGYAPATPSTKRAAPLKLPPPPAAPRVVTTTSGATTPTHAPRTTAPAQTQRTTTPAPTACDFGPC